MNKYIVLIFSVALLAGGCAAKYRWTSRVPEEYRTVAVPVFENRTQDPELGSIVSQYTLREFQREGTFKIRRTGDAAIEVQGSVERSNLDLFSYDRKFEYKAREYRYYVTVKVSIVNKKTGRVLREGVSYTTETTVLANGGDVLTGRRNAAQRVANDLARQIVDDVLSYPYNKPGAVEGVQK